MTKVAVIGAGIVGVACARALLRDGHRVTIYDPEPPGKGTSFGNAGHIAIDHIRPLARLDILAQVPRMLTDPLGPLAIRWRDVLGLVPWLTRFALAARPAQVERGTTALAALLRGASAAWAEELRGSNLAGLFRAKGSMVVFHSDSAFASGEAERALLRRHGIAVETFDGDEARRRAPGLSPAIRHATYYPAASHLVDPYGLVTGLAETFVREGGLIETSAVTGCEGADGRVQKLVTAAGPVPVDAVVLAAGLGSSRLGPLFGVSLPMVAERGYHVMLEAPSARFEIPVTWSEYGFVLTPMESIGIRLAGTVELADEASPPSWRRADILVENARRLFPELNGRETSRWMGMRPTLPDYLPAIGPSPRQRNVFIACGHQHIGLTSAAVTAHLIRDLVAGAPPTIDLAPFSPARFG